jgi:hypothetical protein
MILFLIVMSILTEQKGLSYSIGYSLCEPKTQKPTPQVSKGVGPNLGQLPPLLPQGPHTISVDIFILANIRILSRFNLK